MYYIKFIVNTIKRDHEYFFSLFTFPVYSNSKIIINQPFILFKPNDFRDNVTRKKLTRSEKDQ